MDTSPSSAFDDCVQEVRHIDHRLSHCFADMPIKPATLPPSDKNGRNDRPMYGQTGRVNIQTEKSAFALIVCVFGTLRIPTNNNSEKSAFTLIICVLGTLRIPTNSAYPATTDLPATSCSFLQPLDTITRSMRRPECIDSRV